LNRATRIFNVAPKSMDNRDVQHTTLSLLKIPHFSRGKYVNNCIKHLLTILHGVFLWMERLVSIDVDLISFIIGLSLDGEKTTQYLEDKTKEKELIEKMKNTYRIDKGSRGIIIKRINELKNKLATKLMT